MISFDFSIEQIGPTCSKSAATQMSELVNYLNSNCKTAWSGRVWLDIEGSQYWLGSYTNNQNWYQVSELCFNQALRMTHFPSIFK
jgi:hypothetical protein